MRTSTVLVAASIADDYLRQWRGRIRQQLVDSGLDNILLSLRIARTYGDAAAERARVLPERPELTR